MGPTRILALFSFSLQSQTKEMSYFSPTSLTPVSLFPLSLVPNTSLVINVYCVKIFSGCFPNNGILKRFDVAFKATSS
jgi:hypothetical protein